MYAKRKNIRIVAGLLIVGLLVLIGQSRHLQEDYASEVFRFHVIANSDTEEDQALKLQVRDQVGAYVEKVAGQEIAKEGYTYPVTAAIEDVDFPEKFYGIYHLPAGNYTSLQVRIGQAQGKNWWCVMYPNMCFRDNTYEVVGEDEKEQMYQVFTLYQYKKLIESEAKQIRFRYL